MYAFAAQEAVKVYGGAARPLLRPPRHDAEIHGPDGLGGVEGLPSAESASVRERIESGPAIEAIASAIRQTWNGGAGAKVTLVASGPLTNIALFVSVYTDLFDAIERIVFMGGGIGVGNRSAVAGLSIRSPIFFFFASRSSHLTLRQSLIFCAIVGFHIPLPRLPHA